MAEAQSARPNINKVREEGPLSSNRVNVQKIIFFSPHYDDAAFSCGGLIDQLIASQQFVQVVTVFGKTGRMQNLSPFGAHLHVKWQLTDQDNHIRAQENQAALSRLGVQDITNWDFLEAPYRLDQNQQPLYLSYQALFNSILDDDQPVIDQIKERIKAEIKDCIASLRLYFPLTIGSHVDHQILHQIGWSLLRDGCEIVFYEEWPYINKIRFHSIENLQPASYPVDLERKLDAACCYTSQLWGLGGSRTRLRSELIQYSKILCPDGYHERFWHPLPEQAGDVRTHFAAFSITRSVENKPGLLSSLVKIIQWPELSEVLPVGRGLCLDIGCGKGLNRTVIQAKGYQWLGADLQTPHTTTSHTDPIRMSFQNASFDSVVSWQLVEDPPDLGSILSEVSRILKPGGVFCGTIPGSEFQRMNSISEVQATDSIKNWLSAHDFADIAVYPGFYKGSFRLIQLLFRYDLLFFAQMVHFLTGCLMLSFAVFSFVLMILKSKLKSGSVPKVQELITRLVHQYNHQFFFVARKDPRTAHAPCISDL